MKGRLVLKIILIFIGLIIIILILVPGFARNYLEKHSKELIGRKIEIEKIRLNYLSSTIRIYNFKLLETDEKEIFVSFDTLLVNLQPLNFIQNELVIEQLYLQGLYANIIQEDSTFNFDDIIAFFNKPADSTETDTETDTTPSKPMRFRMYDLEMKQAHFIYDDRNVGKATHLRDFSFTVPFIAWNQADKSEAGIRFAFAQEGYFESSLKIDPVSGEYLGDVKIQRLHLAAFEEYVKYYTNLQALGGIFSCHLDITGNINFIDESLVSGTMEILDLVMTDQHGEKVIGTERIDIGMKKIDYAQSRYEIDSLVLTSPYVHFVLSDTSDNISALFSMPADSAAPVATEADTIESSEDKPLFYSLGAFIIKNGTVDYTDNLTGEPFNYHLSEIVLNTDSITTEAAWVDLYSQMLLNNRGTLKAQVGFNPSDPVNNINLDYVITDFLLSDLNIYSRFYMGFPILLGDMYYKSETNIDKGKLSSENKLIMTNVELGRKGGGLYDVPVKLALFILKDRNGVINLDVPVRGDLNDPKVRIGKLIWITFKNLIIKVATAPYDALAGSIGADPKDLETIEFDFLDTTLTGNRQHQLDLLLELEKSKEGLKIELVYFNDAKLEADFVKQEAGIVDEEAVRQYVELLSASRVKILEKYLRSVNDSTRVIVSIANPQDPKNLGTRPVFRINYSMKEE
jgi:hypothetical protein